jgi:hypothetical protein
VAAALGASVLAGGTASAADQVFLAQTVPAPQLKGITADTLSEMGVSLHAAHLPPYCGLVSVAREHGITALDNAGCPVSRSRAQASFEDAFPGAAPSPPGSSLLAPVGPPTTTVLDTVLARASVPRQPLIGSDRLVWLFVVQGGLPIYRMRPLTACPSAPGGIPRSACRAPVGNLTQLVFVDAQTSRYLTALPVGLTGSGLMPVRGGAASTPRTVPLAGLP